MIQKLIGLYPNVGITADPKRISVEDFYEMVKNGEWQDAVLNLRAAKAQGQTKADTDKLKKGLPLITASGLFTNRTDATIEKHSGFLCIDLDYDTVNACGGVLAVKEELQQDPLMHSVFISCSGTGVCGLVKINPKAHLESFFFIAEHLYNKYGLNIDAKCKNTSRARFVSYDPDIYINPDSQLCPVKPMTKKERTFKPKKYYFNTEDFDRIIADINEAELDLTADYQDWFYAGFALADKFDEDGRTYFHEISKFHPDYDYERTDAKYSHLLRSKEGSITIDWFYYVVEKNGLKAYGKGTEDFLQQTLAEQRAFDAGLIDTKPLSSTVLLQADIKSADTGIQIKNFLHKAYSIRKNEMTTSLEIDGEMLDDELLNTIYLLCRSVIEKIGSRELVYQVIDSRFTPRYHPFKDLMLQYAESPPTEPRGHITALIATIDMHDDRMGLFIKKWLVAIVGSILGRHSPLMLILSGPQNCGKTSWFRQLLPQVLLDYYAESKLDAHNKDTAILMSKKVLIMDDEMSGKSKQEENSMKSMSSQQTIDLRVPYGRTLSKLIRMAMLCGTSNENELISDPTGNRRLITVGITQVNFEAYNAIDKGLLLYECYLEYMEGFNMDLTNAEITLLNELTDQFKKSVPEEELISKYFITPEEALGAKATELTCTEIFGVLKENTRIPITMTAVGRYLKKLGFQQRHKKVGKTTVRVYAVVKTNEFENELIDIL